MLQLNLREAKEIYAEIKLLLYTIKKSVIMKFNKKGIAICC